VYTKTKDYTDDGTVEIIKTQTTITIRTYIGGDAYGAPLYVEKIKNLATGVVVDKKYYLHRDYLGTIIAISDENGAAIERRHFDAWGNLAKLQQNGVAIALPTDGTATKLLLLDRGYTSHEHLSEVGLIHMNGRLYDPVLRSFLMPDNFIQQPENTQNYNRYAYVLNNPLMYTDPSGEIGILLAIGIGAAVSALTYTMTALLADVPFSVGGLLKATFIGAASAAVTFGIGSASTSLFTNFYSQAAFQAVAHGTFQGTMTAISGGKFWSGFAAGALSSIASSAWGGGTTKTEGFSAENNWAYGAKTIHHAGLGAGTGTAGMIAFGTVAGGAGAALTGGNFWQGAVTGLVVSGLNHAAHEIDPPSGKKNHPWMQKFYKSQFIENQYFAAESGLRAGNYFDFTLIKKVFGFKLGEYRETSYKAEYFNNKGNVTQTSNHFFEVAAAYYVGASYKYNLGQSRFESASLSFFGVSAEYSVQSQFESSFYFGIDTGVGLGLSIGGFANIKAGWKFNF
jgi:RHS repeat-associated protein